MDNLNMLSDKRYCGERPIADSLCDGYQIIADQDPVDIPAVSLLKQSGLTECRGKADVVWTRNKLWRTQMCRAEGRRCDSLAANFAQPATAIWSQAQKGELRRRRIFFLCLSGEAASALVCHSKKQRVRILSEGPTPPPLLQITQM